MSEHAESGTGRVAPARRRAAAVIVGVALLAFTLVNCPGAGSRIDPRIPEAPKAGHPWLSGVWVGGATSARPIREFGRWRGSEVEALTTYPAYETWQEIAESDWHVSTFNGFEGRLVYGLPLLPSKGEGTLRDVAEGDYDHIWRAVGRTLVRHGRPDAFVRVGVEANGFWFPWKVDADNAEDFKAAFRRVVGVLRAIEPRLTMVFDLSCGVMLRGSSDRLAGITLLYPGDDVVDVIACDHFDSFQAIARTEGEWQGALRPTGGPGLLDIVDFARKHGKPIGVAEWSVQGPNRTGGGDNPFFIRRMYDFFWEHRDILVFENYFEEPGELRSALQIKPQNPRSAEVYRELW